MLRNLNLERNTSDVMIEIASRRESHGNMMKQLITASSSERNREHSYSHALTLFLDQREAELDRQPAGIQILWLGPR